jgi:hypothetical protein
MSTPPTVDRDERTVVVENASYRWAYMFVTFGLLVLVVYRSYVHNESPWDLMALVILGGLLSAAYQWFHKVRPERWVPICLTIVAAGVLAAVLAWLR